VVLVEDPAARRVGLVPVHPVEDHPAAVDQEPVAADLHRTETEPQGHGLRGRGHRRVVPEGQLGRPRPYVADVERAHLGRRRPGLLDAESRHPQGDREGSRFRGDLGIDAPAAAGVAGAQPDVLQAAGRAGDQGDVAEDPRQPPLVLVLEIAGGRPLVHAHRDHVVARPQRGAHVELVGQPAAARRADLGAVHPDAEERLDAVEPQHDPPVTEPVRGHLDAAAVVAGRVLVGHVRSVDGERVLDVGVDRFAVRPGQHPVRRHGELVPAAVVEAVGREIRRRRRRR
jgi:hypothetical protein